MLKKYSKVLIVFMVLFSLGFPSAVNANSSLTQTQKECPTCSGEKPNSTGSKINIEKAKNIVFSSEQFKIAKKELKGEFDKEGVIVNAPEKKGPTASLDSAVVAIPVENSELNNIAFNVNLQKSEVVDMSKTYVKKVNEETANVKIENNGEVKNDLTLTSDKVIDNLASKEYTYEDFIEKNNKKQDEVKPMMSCEDALGMLTSAGGATQCALICGDLLVLGGLPGLGCGAICSAALFLPLDKAVDKICN